MTRTDGLTTWAEAITSGEGNAADDDDFHSGYQKLMSVNVTSPQMIIIYVLMP